MAETQTSLFASSVLAKWCMTVLFASVAPLVQTMSFAWQPRKCASFSRASRERDAGARAELVRAGRVAGKIFRRIQPGFTRLAHDGRCRVIIEINHRPDKIHFAAKLASFLCALEKASESNSFGDSQTPADFFGEFVQANMKRFQRHPITRDGMFDGAKRLKFRRLEIESRIKNFLRAPFFRHWFQNSEIPTNARSQFQPDAAGREIFRRAQ